jgi:hypothetical protein
VNRQSPPERILYVDDEREAREAFACAAHELGFRVDTADGGGEALTKASQNRYAVIAADLRMPTRTAFRSPAPASCGLGKLPHRDRREPSRPSPIERRAAGRRNRREALEDRRAFGHSQPRDRRYRGRAIAFRSSSDELPLSSRRTTPRRRGPGSLEALLNGVQLA